MLEEEPGVGDPDRGTRGGLGRRGGESCKGEGWEGRRVEVRGGKEEARRIIQHAIGEVGKEGR